MLQGLGVETGAAILQLMRQHNQQIIKLQRQQARHERELRDIIAAVESLRTGQEELLRKVVECSAPLAIPGPREPLPPVPPTPPGETADWATVEALAALTQRVEELERDAPEVPASPAKSISHRSSLPATVQTRKGGGKVGGDKETAMAVKALQHLHMLLRSRVDQQEQQLRSLAMVPQEEMTHLRAEIADIAEIVHQLHKRLATDIPVTPLSLALPPRTPDNSGSFSMSAGTIGCIVTGRRSGSSSPSLAAGTGAAGPVLCSRVGSMGRSGPNSAGNSAGNSRGASVTANAAAGPREIAGNCLIYAPLAADASSGSAAQSPNR